MKSKASAPGKVILFGEHFVVYGIKSILCSINKRVTVTAEKTNERKISINSEIGTLVLDPDESITKINSPLKPFYYLANKALKDQNEGLKIQIESEIPLGAGLGSSSACCVAGAAAIFKVFGEISKEKILELAIEAEKTIYQNTSGADCTVSTYGGLMEYDKNNGFRKIEDEPNFQLIIVNSNIKHSTETMVSKVKEFENKNKEKFHELSNLESKLVNDVLKLIKENKIEEIGEKLNLNQKFLEEIGISNEQLETMIKIGQKSSYGAKITGSGGGGCIFALTNNSNLEYTLKEFTNKEYECFAAKIDFKGLNTF
ncbi:mevalonate kinase [Nitrosopumilus sp. Nsub]|uniref:mevalonate kinase n=1 Tax=Nitrosopumilus sp. Nsub TaxID=1776294 RepID=UPI00082F6776|nr:mevalonate kinase [Nitrosopumilus sp. Nsub]